MSEPIIIDMLSREHHLNQMLTGFHRYAKHERLHLHIRDCSESESYEYKTTALIVYLDGKKIVYDLGDGYLNPVAMRYLEDISDAYYKRSYSETENTRCGLSKVQPLGMNYDVTWIWNPLTRGRKLGYIESAIRYFHGSLITPERVEQTPEKYKDNLSVLFFVRLWPAEEYLSEQKNDQRMMLNRMRVDIIRQLRKELGPRFRGGVEDSDLSRTIASDLVLGPEYTKRRNYLRIMRQSDVCIATEGLHRSTGWKMGEYVAASRAIVSETPYYDTVGDFLPRQNYLPFATADECLDNVVQLMSNPDDVYKMKCNNHTYYQKYLEPEQLVRNSLHQSGLI